jgi:hypothetical protein
MSESNPNQISIQINQTQTNQIKEIMVPKRVYNVIRSIVDSSTKQTYEWNKPIVVDMKTVKFVKYKTLQNSIEVKAWEVVVMPMNIQRENLTLTGTVIKVFDGLGNEVADLTIRDEFTITEFDVKEPNRYSIVINDVIVGAKSIHEYEYYLVSPSDPVPYAKPISLAAFVNKLVFYYSKALSVIKNVDANENDNI